MDKGGMRLVKCSTSTDVEHAHDLGHSTKEEKKRKKSTVLDVNSQEEKKHKKSTKHSRKVKKVRASKKRASLDVTIAGLAATVEDVHDEIQNLTESFKEMTETMKKLQEVLPARADLPEETPNKKVEIKPVCAFAAGFPYDGGPKSIFVKGFSTSLRRDEVNSALIEHFSPCGEITRVFVPFRCYSVTSLGYAFVDFKEDESKALLLDGSCMGGNKLEVKMARGRPERSDLNFGGCRDCGRNRVQYIKDCFYNRRQLSFDWH